MIRRAIAAVLCAGVAGLLGVGEGGSPALAHGFQDQSLASDPGCLVTSLRASASSTSVRRQEVVPAASGLTGVDVCLTLATTSVVTVKIRSGTAAGEGVVLAQENVNATAGTHWIHTELATPIATPPGEMFVIELSGFPAYSWRGTCGQVNPPDCPTADAEQYAAGGSNSGPTIGDFAFRTYDPGDTDLDGMPDGYEILHDACLDRLVADASGDPDVDGLTSGQERALGTQPCTAEPNSDGDGCSDMEEGGPTPSQGGDRDPLVPWDFFDVPAPAGPATGADGKLIVTPGSMRNKAVTLQDVGVVLAYVGRTSANPAYSGDNNADTIADGQQLDRTPSALPAKPWRSGPPNNAISLQDVGVALSQVGHSCVAPP
jgi:hypothetical protein